MEYHKIDTLFERDGKFIVTDKLNNPVYGSFRSWHVTEKIDGTNIRVTLTEEGKVVYGGRTDNAQLPADLVTYLQETFTPERMQAAFWLSDESGQVQKVRAILYGEGYGAGIQSGGVYRSDKAFRLFDVLVADQHWLDWHNVEDVARKLGIKTAPYLGDFSMEQIVEMVKKGVPSRVSVEDSGQEHIAEGIVGRTIEPLFDRRGKRIILKLKTKDFGKA